MHVSDTELAKLIAAAEKNVELLREVQALRTEVALLKSAPLPINPDTNLTIKAVYAVTPLSVNALLRVYYKLGKHDVHVFDHVASLEDVMTKSDANALLHDFFEALGTDIKFNLSSVLANDPAFQGFIMQCRERVNPNAGGN